MQLLELRESDAGPGVIHGAVMVYNSPTVVGRIREAFQPGSFRNLQSPDITANLNHDRGRLLGRNGSNLRFEDTQTELRVELTLLDTMEGRDARVAVENGLLRGWSVEFQAMEARDEGGIRRVRSALLGGVALTAFPAYRQTNVTAGRPSRMLPLGTF